MLACQCDAIMIVIQDWGPLLQDYAERRALRAELKMLQKEERQRQQRAVDEVLKVGSSLWHARMACQRTTA